MELFLVNQLIENAKDKAAKIVEEMEDAGLVSSANHVGKREILVPER